MDLLAIVTITRNDRAGLARTLSSVRTNPHCEDIAQIVVDGSDDAEAAKTKAYVAEEYPSCTYVRQTGTGISDAFNLGAEAAHAEYLWFLNGGDAVEAHADFDILRRFLEASFAPDVVVFRTVDVAGNDFMPVVPLQRLWPIVTNWIPHPSTIVRRQALLNAGGFDHRLKIAMDLDLWYRLILADAVFSIIPWPLSVFSFDGVSSIHSRDLHKETRLVMRRYSLRVLLRGMKNLARYVRTALNLGPV